MSDLQYMKNPLHSILCFVCVIKNIRLRITQEYMMWINTDTICECKVILLQSLSSRIEVIYIQKERKNLTYQKCCCYVPLKTEN